MPIESYTEQSAKATKKLNKNAKERLNLAGIDFDRDPTITTYPKFYNPQAHSLWAQVLKTMTFRADSHVNWQVAIKDFQDICYNANVAVFNEDALDTFNESIASSLKANRVQAIKACDDTEIFKHFSIRSIVRRVAVLNGQDGRNFYVENVAKLHAVKDPTLERWLLSSPLPGFIQPEAGRYEKLVNAATTVTINFTSKAVATITLCIHCHSMPMIPHRKTTQSMARFIESKIWDPIVQKYRFKDVGRKLF